jgi:hypothetical protein
MHLLEGRGPPADGGPIFLMIPSLESLLRASLRMQDESRRWTGDEIGCCEGLRAEKRDFKRAERRNKKK